MLNSVLRNLPTPLAFVCNDAGAANLIFAWMHAEAAKHPDMTNDWNMLLQGAALRLWTENSLPQVHMCQTIDELLNGTHVLVAGTGWASNIEYDSIQMARQRGIRTIAVIDHWTNYRARFVRNEVEELPDKIWVTDEYAIKLAESEFKNIEVVQMPNLYLDNIVQEVRIQEKMNRDGNNLLYLLEPIRDAWGDGVVNGEFKGLDYFIENLNELKLSGKPSVQLRPHPSDPSGKYDEWISVQSNLNISLDKSVTLAESIAWSDVVVGCQTYAMVIALAAGKQVFSSVPPWAPSCVLPQEDIIKISELAYKKSSMADINN
jgi:hypothetical protein